MTTHEQALHIATTALDFPVTADEDRMSRDHITECPACRAAAASLAADARVIGELPAAQPSARVTMAVHDAVRRADVRRRTSTAVGPFQPLVAFALVALLVAALVGAAVAGAGLEMLDRDSDLAVIATPSATPILAAQRDVITPAPTHPPRRSVATARSTPAPEPTATTPGPGDRGQPDAAPNVTARPTTRRAPAVRAVTRPRQAPRPARRGATAVPTAGGPGGPRARPTAGQPTAVATPPIDVVPSDDPLPTMAVEPATPSPSPSAEPSTDPSPSDPTASPTPEPSASPSVSPGPSASASPGPTPVVTDPPEPTPDPTRRPTPAASDDAPDPTPQPDTTVSP